MNAVVNTVRYRMLGSIAAVILDHPPVNAMGRAVRTGIKECLERANADDAVRAVIVMGSESAFSGGADIKEFGTPLFSRELSQASMRVPDTLTKPLVAAIGGFALGGGLELALCCHYRVALPGARLGLPEVKIGRTPGTGGTQRLPRLIGLEEAARMVLSGDLISSEAAAKLGLIDEIVQGDLLQGALQFIEGLLVKRAGVRRLRDMSVECPDPEGFFSAKRAELARTRRGYVAPLKLLECLEAAARLPFDEGMAVEARCNEELRDKDEDRALRHLFAAERAAAKVPDLSRNTVSRNTPARRIDTAVIVGTGAGDDIARSFVEANIAVKLLGMDAGEAASGQDLSVVSGGDIVVLAGHPAPEVVESISRHMREDAILALPCDAPPAALSRATTIHAAFTRGAYGQGCLELMQGEATGLDVLATLMALGKRLGRLVVVSGVRNHCISTRLLDKCHEHTDALLRSGVSCDQINRAMEDWGFDIAAPHCGRWWFRPGQHPDASAGNDAVRAPQIVDRLLCAIVDEGAALVAEGVALRPSDIDVLFTSGYGFPRYKGGPMYWADQ